MTPCVSAARWVRIARARLGYCIAAGCASTHKNDRSETRTRVPHGHAWQARTRSDRLQRPDSMPHAFSHDARPAHGSLSRNDTQPVVAAIASLSPSLSLIQADRRRILFPCGGFAMPTHSSPARPTSGPVPAARARADGALRPARLAGDGRVPARGAGHARGLADHARHGPADPQRLHAGAGTGPIDLRPAVRPHRPAAGAAGRRAAVCRRVAGAGRRRQRRALRRVAAATGAGRLGRAGGHVRHRARCLCRPAGRQHHLWPVQRHAGLRPRARADARRGHRGGLRLAGDLRRAGRGGPAGVVARHAALARDPSIHAGRGGRLRAPCWAACGSGSIRWDSARRWAPSSCSSRPRRACSWAPPATRTWPSARPSRRSRWS